MSIVNASQTNNFNTFSDIHVQLYSFQFDMRGIHANPHYLQAIILLFSSFFLLASFIQYLYISVTYCRYVQNDHDDVNETNNENSIECIGNSITAGAYGLVTLLTFAGVISSAMKHHHADIYISFVIFGILVSYTCAVFTNLRVNCLAGDTTDQNLIDDDSFDSAKSKCQTYTYAAVGGCLGCVGGFVGGYYGVLMKLNNGKFYIQRPIGLFVAMAGYALIYCFNQLAEAFPWCHYYENGKDQLSETTNILPIEDDIVYGQLEPLCEGYENTAIGYGVAAFVAFSGIPVMFKFEKRGMWIIFALFCVLCSSSNYSTFFAAKASNCDSTDNYLSNIPGAYTSYEERGFSSGCKNYDRAMTTSYFAMGVSSAATVIGIIDTAIHIDHDTFYQIKTCVIVCIWRLF